MLNYRGEFAFLNEYCSSFFVIDEKMCFNILCKKKVLCCNYVAKNRKMWCNFVEKLCNSLWKSLWVNYGKVFCQWWKSIKLCFNCGKIVVLHSFVEKFSRWFCTLSQQIRTRWFCTVSTGFTIATINILGSL